MNANVLSLFELNSLVKELLDGSFTDSYWITAELSEVRTSAKGHCFIELVEKGQRGAAPRAKASAVIYSYLFPMLRLTFEEATGQLFCAGIKVQLKVQVAFSEIYGYSLVVKDIDPAYTLGSMAQLRKEILDRLLQEGVYDMNGSLPLARPLQRIAVISSATAAGYGDFCNQLDHNAQGYAFCHRLFPAVMQGESTAASIIAALDQIAAEAEQWDAVVIIRGGGAVSDLAGFEDYELAASCAQFPLPIIVGIGHDRDVTVLDFVANFSLKTPTAVAAFLIGRMDCEVRELAEIEDIISTAVFARLTRERENLQRLAMNIRFRAGNFCTAAAHQLQARYDRFANRTLSLIENHRVNLQHAERLLRTDIRRKMQDLKQQLDTFERTIALYNPDRILSLGYSIARINGKAVVSVSQLRSGDKLVVQLADGEAQTIVENAETKKLDDKI